MHLRGVAQSVRAAHRVRAASSIDKVHEQLLRSSSTISPDNTQHDLFRPSELSQSSVAHGAMDLRKNTGKPKTANISDAPEQSSSQFTEDSIAPSIDPVNAPRGIIENDVQASVPAHVQTNVHAPASAKVNALQPPPESPDQLRQEVKEMIELRDEVLGKTGRQNGPDIALKVIFNMKDKKYDNYLKHIINENSSITEVMNVFAFLVNTMDNRKNSIVKEFSFFKYEHGPDGDYTKINIDEYNEDNERNEDYETQLLSVFNVLEGVNFPLFDIDTFQPYAGVEKEYIILPAGIIKRHAVSYHTAPIEVQKKDIPKLFTLCILQMINILEKTRGVFGGWTKLFKEMQGGGTKSKSTTKKTRRSNNCRRN
jgi:hypothetical protein